MKWYHSYETLELNTPSRLDGVDFEEEARYRKEGARFIMDIGNKLGLPYITMASGIVFYHRFYMFHSFKEFSRWVTATTCLFLAGKVEETPKKCKDILKITQQSIPDYRFKAFGDNPREEMMVIERILLQTIKFDLHLNHPYAYLIKFGKLLKGDMEKINGFVQKAWIFINDSLSTTLCLRYKPQVIGLAVLLLSFKLSNQNIRDFMGKPRTDWWKIFYAEAKEQELEDICEELTNMYSGKPPKRRFPNVNIADKIKNSPKNPPGSPQTKKPKLQSTSESPSKTSEPSATTATATTATTTTTVSNTPSTTSITTTTTTSTLTTVATTVAASAPPPLPPLDIKEVSTKPSTQPTSGDPSSSSSSSSITTVEPMQLATPTTNIKVSFPPTTMTATSNLSTPSKQPPPPDLPPYHQPPIHHQQHRNEPPPLHPPQPPMMNQPPLPPNSFGNEGPPHHLPPQQPPMLKPRSPKRHEQLKSYLHQNSPTSQPSTGFPSQQQNSPYKATAPILDHMSSFFQSTPPPQSKSQQPPSLNKPPRPSFPGQQNQQSFQPQQQNQFQQSQQNSPFPQQQNSPAHVMQPATPPISMMEQLTKQRLPLTPNLKTQMGGGQPQQRFNNQNNFNQFNNTQPPNLSNFQPQLNVPTFGAQNNTFMPMPPQQGQQQPQPQPPFMNNPVNSQAPMNNFNTFNPQQQQSPMHMQQNQRPPHQNQMNNQRPPYPGNFY